MARKTPRKSVRQLSEREQRFVYQFLGPCAGNRGAAATAAGYSPKLSKSAAYRLLHRPVVQAALKVETDRRQSAGVAAAIERDVIVSEIARDVTQPGATRLAACDLLNRVEGRYVTRVDVTGEVDLRVTAESISHLSAADLDKVAAGLEAELAQLREEMRADQQKALPAHVPA